MISRNEVQIAKAAREKRIAYGMTQTEVSKTLKIDRVTYTNFELKKANLMFRDGLKIMKFFKLKLK